MLDGTPNMDKKRKLEELIRKDEHGVSEEDVRKYFGEKITYITNAFYLLAGSKVEVLANLMKRIVKEIKEAESGKEFDEITIRFKKRYKLEVDPWDESLRIEVKRTPDNKGIVYIPARESEEAEAKPDQPQRSALSDEMVGSIERGEPLYLQPYKEKKVWGVGGIGEFWYGAEKGEQSSVAKAGDDTARMDAIIENAPEEVLGKDVVSKFGPKLPLVKILTPKSRLSVQFHDVKDETWIVTGIDESAAGEDPHVVLGFRPEVVRD
ncbi:MAG: type I phosphomannose isomerase catalytic subunit [Candidatus Omnitrophota bacterium]